MAGIYQPDNSVQAAVYGVSPLKKIKIRLDSVDRSQGQVINEIQGDTLYVEKTDYPFLISFITADTLEQACVVARAGLRIRGFIKQVTVTHPLLTIGNNATLNASLIMGAGGAAENSFAFPFHQGLVPISVTTNSATNFNGLIHVPRGARHLSELEMSFTGTTLTGAGFALIGDTTASVDTSPTLVDDKGQAFVTAVQAIYTPDLVPTIAGTFKLRQTNVPLPGDCRMIQFTITGTVFSGSMADKSVKVVMA